MTYCVKVRRRGKDKQWRFFTHNWNKSRWRKNAIQYTSKERAAEVAALLNRTKDFEAKVEVFSE